MSFAFAHRHGRSEYETLAVSITQHGLAAVVQVGSNECRHDRCAGCRHSLLPNQVRKHLLQVLPRKPLPAHHDPDELLQLSDILKRVSFK